MLLHSKSVQLLAIFENITIYISPGTTIQGKGTDEVLEVRDHGRGHMVSSSGGTVIITGEEIIIIKTNLIVLYRFRLRESMIFHIQHLSCMQTEFIICLDHPHSMATVLEVKIFIIHLKVHVKTTFLLF